MSIEVFLSGVGALLLAPGPTNTLMALAGARDGIRGLRWLILAELAGYLAILLPLTWLGAEALGQWNAASIYLKLAAAMWVMFLAVRFWVMGGNERECEVTVGRVFLTTFLSPKALVFGLVFLPSMHDPFYVTRLCQFCAFVVAVTLIWGAAGDLIQGGGGARRLQLIHRAGSLWLASAAAALAAGIAGLTH